MDRTEEKIKAPILDALEAYLKENILSFDVPGHKKRGKLAHLQDFFGERILALDANSMKQLDNLSNPTGILKESEDLFAQLFMADSAHFLVNGSTGGVQAMILAACRPGEKIIVPRNVHKSVINAIILAAAEPVYVHPEIDLRFGIATSLSYDQVIETIDANRDAKAILLVNPSYYGACGCLERITEYAHNRDLMVLVDEAHGAHLPFSEELPICAMEAGADMATVSTHKTGGSLTQSSVLLVKHKRIDTHRIKSVLNMLQTTSASYLLLASIDAARCELALNGQRYVREALQLSRYARETLSKIDGLYLMGTESIGAHGVAAFDETKLVIHTAGVGLTGFEFYDLLRNEYSIQLELADTTNVLALITLGDTQEGVERLIVASSDLVARHRKKPIRIPTLAMQVPPLVISPREAFHAQKRPLPFDRSVGEISGEIVTLYPPGIPLIMPGERITQEIIDYIRLIKEENGTLVALGDPDATTLDVIGV